MPLRTLPEQAFRRRARMVAVVFCAVCLGLAARLFYLQLRTSRWYTDRALGQQLRDTVVPADRGKIYSADGVLLAANSSCWTLRASPREMPDDKLSLAAEGLADILDLDAANLLESFRDRRSNDCLLRYRVDRTTADRVREFCEANGITGIRINQDSKRWYPQGQFLASVLGFTNVDNAGVSGLELQYDGLLTGENGVVLTAVNAWGYTLEQSYETERFPTEGDGLRLTIDTQIQHYLENALGYAVQEHHVAARAVGIVMDVNTGAVLAMSTTPSYDPNEPRVIADEAARNQVESLSGEARRAALQLAQQTQWRNKAVSDLYEPGSVFKLITCAAALDAGAITRHSSFYCGESISVAGTRFHCANHKRHGAQTVTQALENSCNQSFIQIGARLGREAFCSYFAAFGLREPTGIDLPAEPKKSLYYTADRMGPVELASCAFGQSSKISYLEMAAAVCAVVNGGKLMRPYVVSDILAPDGSLIEHIGPACTRQVLKAETSAVMREMMEAVVLYGGGRNAQIAGYRVGGKSGTSQKLDSTDEKARIASFVAVAPIDDPQFLCLTAGPQPAAASRPPSAPRCWNRLSFTRASPAPLCRMQLPPSPPPPTSPPTATASMVPNKKDRRSGLKGSWLILLRLLAEPDLTGGRIHGLDDGEALQLDALAADQLAALLEALLDGDADALDGGPGLIGQFQQAHQGAAVGQEIVDDEDMVFRGEELFGDDDVIDLFVGEGLDLGLVIVVVQIDAHGLFGKDHRHIELAGDHCCNADAAGFNGQHFVDGLACKQALPLFCHLAEQRDVHLVVDEAVHLQHVALAHDAVLANPIFQQFHFSLFLQAFDTAFRFHLVYRIPLPDFKVFWAISLLFSPKIRVY